MDPSILLILVASFTALLPLEVGGKPISKITVMGTVFCDTCSNNTFSKHSYFLQGVEVHVECKFKANSTAEQVSLSVNRTTSKYGVYVFEFPSIDGFRCKEGHEMGSVCKASLLRSSSFLCNVPGLKKSTGRMEIKSKQDNLCIYSLNALNYRPPKRDLALCGAYKGESPSSLNVSDFFFPPFPPLGFPPIPYLPPFPPLPQLPPLPQFPPFPPLPQLPPFPNLPPLPKLPPLPQLPPFPPLPSLPFPFPNLPPLPKLPPLPQLPPFPPPPSLPFPFPTPPASPFLIPPPLPIPPTPSIVTPSPPPPHFSLTDPRSWFPFIHSSPPPPPPFSLENPRTWFPFLPPSPPNKPQNQHP